MELDADANSPWRRVIGCHRVLRHRSAQSWWGLLALGWGLTVTLYGWSLGTSRVKSVLGPRVACTPVTPSVASLSTPSQELLYTPEPLSASGRDSGSSSPQPPYVLSTFERLRWAVTPPYERGVSTFSSRRCPIFSSSSQARCSATPPRLTSEIHA
jgi:hypothetical protein